MEVIILLGLTRRGGHIMAEVTKTTTKEMTREELHYRATEPEYVKVYLKDILYLSDMPEGYTKSSISFCKRRNGQTRVCASLLTPV